MDVNLNQEVHQLSMLLRSRCFFYKVPTGLTWAIKPTNYSLTTGKDGFNWRFCRKSKSSIAFFFFDRRKNRID
jgi:hypothetical protein